MKKVKIQILFLVISLILLISGFIIKSKTDLATLALVLFALAFFFGGFFSLIEGIKESFEKRSFNVELLMILAAIGAFMIGDYQEGAVLIFIFALAGILEELAILKSKKELSNLLSLTPSVTTLVIDDKEIMTPVENLLIDQVIKVKVGEQIPVDGIIVEGFTTVDEKMITGEFMPVNKNVGSFVYAGTMVMNSTVLIQVKKNAKETVAQKIVDFVKDAQKQTTKKESFIEKFEKWYVYGVLALAFVVMFVLPAFHVWDNKTAIYKGIIILVVASPCALVASITPAILASLSRSAKDGILIKGGKPLEDLRKTKRVVFDKTGTVTKGALEVVGYHIYDIDEKTFLETVVSIQKNSNHPISKAVVNHFKDVSSFMVTSTEIAGRGIVATIGEDVYEIGRFDGNMCMLCEENLKAAALAGYSTMKVIKNGYMVGFIKLSDEIREDAKLTIATLKKMNIKTHLLSGDQKNVTETITKKLGIDSFKGECYPIDKVKEVKRLKENDVVMMIGDGINDAPALLESDIGVAMGSATDISLEVADIVFINNKLMSVKKVIDLSRKTNRIIWQNIVFSLLVITLLLFTNLFGQIHITLGVISHETSTVLVVLNSLRLLFFKKDIKVET